LNYTDGFKTINFSISSNAGNTIWNSTTFFIDNNPPALSINYPTSGAVLSGSITVIATATDAGSGINLTQFRWENSSIGNWINMTCSGNSCSGTLDTNSLVLGNYTLTVNAVDNGGYNTTQSVPFFVDNIGPNISIVNPNGNQNISGNFLMNITIADNYGLQGSATYTAGNTSGALNCVEKANIQSYSCFGTVNSSIFTDGLTSLKFTTSDLAGNSISSSVNVIFDNFPPVVVYLLVDPPSSKVPTKFTMNGKFDDLGSDISSASGIINLPDGKTSSINFIQKDSNWQAEYSASENGEYTIDVTLIDANSHKGTYYNVTSFSISISKCGNGICESGESCSNCEVDCGKCSGNQTGNPLGSLGGSEFVVFLVIAIAVGGVLAYIFWFKREKSVYPGFKAKKTED
jgi:hypothetical protein